MNPATLAKLSVDQAISVKETLTRSNSFTEWADNATLLQMSQADLSIARQIASSVGSFSNSDTDVLVKELSAYADPAIRMALASNWNLSKFNIRALSLDPEPSVAATAKQALRSR